VARRLPRFDPDEQDELDRKLAKILLETGEPAPVRSGVTAGGDERRLRGVPAVGRGVSGTMAGTDPLGALIANERRRRRRPRG